jgi:hypothetical protein
MRHTFLLGLLVVAACATSPAPNSSDPGILVIHSNAVLYRGPELVATVVYGQGKRSVAEEWLTLAVELTSPDGSGPTVVRRSNISLYAPDGQRLPLASQEEFFRNLAVLRIPLELTLNYLPLLNRYEPGRIPGDRWFFAISATSVGFDEIPISSSQQFSGPLVFSVPGGVQPGRWRLVFDLEESRANIPFTIELKE